MNNFNNDGSYYKSGMRTRRIQFQPENPQIYDISRCLSRGTLFPDLDLPPANAEDICVSYTGTRLEEIIALDFAITDLNLYLDTHINDKYAFEIMKKFIALSGEAREEYMKSYGPLLVADTENSESFDWTEAPWPWELSERAGAK